MLFKRKYLCCFLVVIMFCVFASGGCNNPFDDDDDSPSSNQTTTDTNENTQNDNNENPKQVENENQNQKEENENDEAAEISGTWEIVSGYLILSNDTQVRKAVYVPGKIGNIGIAVTKNEGVYQYLGEGLYAMTLSGENVMQSGLYGSGSAFLDCKYDDNPDEVIDGGMVFMGHPCFRYIGNGTYEETEKELERMGGYTNSPGSFIYTVKRETSTTLRITYWNKADTTEGTTEIMLRKVS